LTGAGASWCRAGWRAAAEPAGALLVGTGTEFDGGVVVLLAPSRLLGGFADAMVGER
jgi:hypothetical protein